jgi:uncharacterized phage protein gp47/JayE
MDISTLVYIDATGYHYADQPTFLAWRQAQYKAIYGSDVYLGSDSQDGQLLAIQATADYQTAALGAAVYNSFAVVGAQGAGLARLVKLNGIKKGVATNSTVDVVIGGSAGTTITNGIVVDTLNQQWLLPVSVTIPSGGSITVTATAKTSGFVNAAIGAVTGIFTPTLGWQTVNNLTAATPGAAVESDANLVARQGQSTALPSLTVMEGTLGAIASLAGVLKVKGYENDTDATDGNSMPPHSIGIVVSGGDSTAIATVIAKKKTPGANSYGTTGPFLITDSRGMPINIYFYRPTPVVIWVNIIVSVMTGWSSDYELLIKDAVAASINANGIAATVQNSKLYNPAYLTGTTQGSTYSITTLEIKKTAGVFSTNNISLAFTEEAYCDPLVNVAVTPV